MFRNKTKKRIYSLLMMGVLITSLEASVPNAPSNYIGVTVIDQTSIRVNFLDNSDNEKGFKIFGEDINISVPAHNENLHPYVYTNITGLTCDKAYTIQALAYNEDGNSTLTDKRSFNIHTTFGLDCDEEIQNSTPNVNAGEDKTTEINKPITLTGTATDSDGSIVSYEWKEGNATLATTASFDYTPTTIGEHNLTLFATDNDGAVGSDSVKITAKDNNTEIDLTNGLVAHYEFEGNANDSSGNGNHGVEHGNINYVDGVIGQAANFDGVDDYINISSIEDITNYNLKEISISAWIMLPQNISGINQIYEGHTSIYEIYLEGDTIQSFLVSHDKINTNNIPTDRWMNITSIFDGNNLKQKIYVNGVLIKEKNLSNNSVKIITGFNLGRDFEQNIQYLKGKLDDLRFYNRVLNQAEILELYNMGKNNLKGLKGTYYGVNTQLKNISQFRSIIENNESTTTAKFIATKLDYGYGTGTVSQGDNLQKFFLKEDASSLSNDPEDTTDGGINLVGKIYLNAGTYNFRVRSDDGYQIKIDDISVAEVNHIQPPTTTTHTSFVIDEDGYHDIDIVWWDQGIEYIFKVELSKDNGATYNIVDSDILFSSEI